MAVTFKDGVILGMTRYLGTSQPSFLAALTGPMRRRRFPDDDGRLHCESRDGQVDEGSRHYMVLPVGLGRRYPSRGRHCAIPVGTLCHAKRQAPHDADCGVDIPRNLLLQQGSSVVSASTSYYSS